MNKKPEEKPNAHNYALRAIPDEMFKALKHDSAEKGGSIRDAIMRALTAYLKK